MWVTVRIDLAKQDYDPRFFFTGQAYVDLAPGHTQLVNPIVVLEGFDLDNSMGWSHAVLDEVGAIFRERYGVGEIAKARRPNLSRPTPTPILEELVRQADFVVAGCGV